MDSIKYKGLDIRSVTTGKKTVWIVQMPGRLSVVSSDISKVLRAIDSYRDPYSYEDAPTEVEEEMTQPIISSKEQ